MKTDTKQKLQRLEEIRRTGVNVNELTKGFTEETRPKDNTFQTMCQLANSVQEAFVLSESIAIAYATWYHNLRPTDRISVWSKEGDAKGIFEMDAEQLFERFKKEKITP